MKKSLVTLATAAVLGLGSTVASAEFVDFTVNETSFNNLNVANTFVADKITGGYTEQITLYGNNTFKSTAYVNFSGFLKNEGTTAVSPSFLNGFFGYNLYAVFTADGTYSGNNFYGNTGTFKLFMDYDQNTTFGVAAGPLGIPFVTLGGDTEDKELASSSSFYTGSGTAGSSYKITFNEFMLEALGAAFMTNFSAPLQTLEVQLTGDFDNEGAATPVLDGLNPIGATYLATGDVSAVFQVPEPATLALMGLALAGAGVVSRRRKQA